MVIVRGKSHLLGFSAYVDFRITYVTPSKCRGVALILEGRWKIEGVNNNCPASGSGFLDYLEYGSMNTEEIIEVWPSRLCRLRWAYTILYTQVRPLSWIGELLGVYVRRHECGRDVLDIHVRSLMDFMKP